MSGYSIVNGTPNTCVPCSANCINCNSSSCLSCAIGYTVISANCVSCSDPALGIAGCITCSTIGNKILCDICSNGFYLLKSKCATCNSTFPNSYLCSNTNIIQCLNDFVLPI
jgi:hypothetical protein